MSTEMVASAPFTTGHVVGKEFKASGFISVDSAAPQGNFWRLHNSARTTPPCNPKSSSAERLREYGRVFGANWVHLKFPFGVSELP